MSERGRFAAFKHRDFALLWSSNIVSRLGTQMRDVAVAWQIWVLTHSKAALGIIGLFRVIPIVIFALGGGVAADAFDRRRVMLTTQTILALTSAVMAWLTFTGQMSTPLLYGAVAVAAAANAFDAPARQSIIANILPDEDLPNGLALGLMGLQVSTVLGPALGGVLLAETSIAAVYAIDAITYGAVICALLIIRPRPTESAEGDGKKKLSLGAIADAFRFLRTRPILIWLMLIDFFATFFAGSLLLMPAFASEIFHVGERGFGALNAAPSAGALLASIVLSYRAPIRRWGAALLGAVIVYGACVAAFGVTTSFVLALALLAGSGAADTVSTVVRQVARQTLTPDAMRGRMTGVNMIFFIGGPQLGEVEAGLLAEATSARVSVVSGGLACIVMAAAVLAAVPSLRRLEAIEATEAAARVG